MPIVQPDNSLTPAVSRATGGLRYHAVLLSRRPWVKAYRRLLDHLSSGRLLMTLRNSSQRYGAVAIGLHWGIAAMVLVGWLTGQFGEELPSAAQRQAGLFAHISIGLALLGFVLVRLGWRLADPPPAPEATRFGPWVARAGEFAHLLIYGLMLALPVLGIMTQFARGHDLSVFGLFEIATPWTRDREFAHMLKEVHEALANGLMLLIGLHATAALVHHYVLHDRTLTRMLPGGRAPDSFPVAR
jgi:cytochrome b561